MRRRRASHAPSDPPWGGRSSGACWVRFSEARAAADPAPAIPTLTQASTAERHAAIGSLFVFTAAVAFSGKSVLIKLAYGYGVDATALFALRQIFSAPFFAFLAWWSRNPAAEHAGVTRGDWLRLAGLGLLGYYVAALLDFLGLEYVGASLERLILFLYPTVVLVLSAWWLKTRIRPVQLVALPMSYAGIGLVFFEHLQGQAPGGHLLLGGSLVFASAIAYSVYLIGSSRVVHRFGAVRFTSWAMLAATAAGITQFALTHGVDALRLPLPVYGLAAIMAIFSTVLPAILMSEGLRRVGANQAALIGTIGPVVTMLLSAVFLGERMGPAQIAGSLLVLAGVLLVSLRRGGPPG
ncbi:MAG: EamA family transporter [Betaproteobacteria bacterium]|nr:EamA family transporter [Betaproteobacteria bacterium]